MIYIVFNWNHFEMRLLNLRIDFYLSPEEGQRSNLEKPLGARGAADRGVESLRFQVSILRR